MSQQTDLFQKALAAKLAGDEAGFQQSVREAIIAKTKDLLAKPIQEGFSGLEDFYVDQVQLPAELASSLGLSSDVVYVEGQASVSYDPGESQSRDHPGYGPELEFEIQSAEVVSEDGTRTPIDPKVLTAALSSEQYASIHDTLMDSSHQSAADSAAERSYARRHGSLPDGY